MAAALSAAFFLSCSVLESVHNELRAAPPGQTIPPSMPTEEAVPSLRIRDYKNREAGASLAPWLRSYLSGGIPEAEALDPYRGSYLFISMIRSSEQAVIGQWVKNFSADQDFSRLAAARIRARLDKDLGSRGPNEYYGPSYDDAVRSAYRRVFWGARKENDSWILGSSAEEGAAEYWGFILVSVPRDSLEIQIHELLAGVSVSKVKEQHEVFDNVKEYFFERF
ncbi:MAG: hypothetical protein LBK77_03155 [Spirochaetaceae bacterium]|jgi:hypothetical protein|nr:hypothetical protein [Spirochaetaceae bacterium]